MAKTWKKPTAKILASIRAECSGRGGDYESETTLHWCKWQPGVVEFYSRKGADVIPIIDRCGSMIDRYYVHEDSVWFRIQTKTPEGKRVFRGFGYAFAPLDVESKPFPGTE